MQQPAPEQTELNLTRKYAKNHSFVPTDHLTAVLTSGLHTKTTIAKLLGVTTTALNDWLRRNAMPKGFSLLCERLISDANAATANTTNIFLVTIPTTNSDTFEAMCTALKARTIKLQL